MQSNPVMNFEATGRARVNLGYLVPICLVATLGGLLFGYDTGVISGAIEPFTAKFALSDLMKGWVSGCVLLGCAVGVLAAGPVSDRLGRKVTMLAAALMFLISAIGTAVPDSVLVFILFRVVGGLGIGLASISTPMYIAEITPAHLRGRMISINQIAIVGGIAITAFVNYWIANSQGDPGQPAVQEWLKNAGWRWMFAAGSVPALVFGILLLFIPESPRWLVEKGRQEEGRAVLDKVGGPEFGRTEFEGIRHALAGETGSWRELWSPAVRWPLALGIGLAVLQQITGINVFLYFGATIFRNMSASTGVDAGLLQQIIINGAGVLFTLVAIATVDHWGRKPLMVAGACGMAVSLAAMGIMAQQSTDSGAGSVWMLGFILLYIACFGLSVGPVTWVILAEIFPNAIRGRALGVATFFLWLADYTVIQTFPLMDAKGSWLVSQFKHAFPFYVYGFFCVVLVVLVWLAVPETKGRTLEQIEEVWKKSGGRPAAS